MDDSVELWIGLGAVALVFLRVATARAGLLRSGRRARGILLNVSPQGNGFYGVGPNRCERRNVTVDIELPGKPPYVARTEVLIPLNLVRDVLPGATVELRVTWTRTVIVGPGVGFTAFTQPRPSPRTS